MYCIYLFFLLIEIEFSLIGLHLLFIKSFISDLDSSFKLQLQLEQFIPILDYILIAYEKYNNFICYMFRINFFLKSIKLYMKPLPIPSGSYSLNHL